MLPAKPGTITEYANKAIEIDNKLYNIGTRHTKGPPLQGRAPHTSCHIPRNPGNTHSRIQNQWTQTPPVFDIVQSVRPEPRTGLDSILAVRQEPVLGRTSPKIIEGRTDCSLMPRRKENLMFQLLHSDGLPVDSIGTEAIIQSFRSAVRSVRLSLIIVYITYMTITTQATQGPPDTKHESYPALP